MTRPLSTMPGFADPAEVPLHVHAAYRAQGRAPYLFLGPASLVEARGGRPISITWRLAVPMPHTFFDAASALVA